MSREKNKRRLMEQLFLDILGYYICPHDIDLIDDYCTECADRATRVRTAEMQDAIDQLSRNRKG